MALFRGDDTILLFLWMDQLRAQADRVGGTFLSLLGNHEWMNAIGMLTYLSSRNNIDWNPFCRRLEVRCMLGFCMPWLITYLS